MLVRPTVVRRTVLPKKEPLTLAEAKAHLRISGVEHDPEVTALLAAARARTEARCERAWLTQTWVALLDGFWGGADLLLPYPPLQSVVIEYHADETDAWIVVDAALYEVDTVDQPGRVRLKPGKAWPAAYSRANAVRVTFVAGFGDDEDEVPENVRHAVKLLLGHYDRNREAVVTGTIATELPEAVESLLFPEWIPWAA